MYCSDFAMTLLREYIMTIYSKKHLRFRNAVTETMRNIAQTAVYVYDDEIKRQRYIEDAVDVAFTTILTCFDDEMYSTLTDTMCRRYAKSDIHDVTEECIIERTTAKENNTKFDISQYIIDNLDADSVLEDIEEMCEDE
jgi:hypothetical protein